MVDSKVARRRFVRHTFKRYSLKLICACRKYYTGSWNKGRRQRATPALVAHRLSVVLQVMGKCHRSVILILVNIKKPFSSMPFISFYKISEIKDTPLSVHFQSKQHGTVIFRFRRNLPGGWKGTGALGGQPSRTSRDLICWSIKERRRPWRGSNL